MFQHMLALSFDSITSPGIELSQKLTNQAISSWGFSWYPSSNHGVSTLRGGRESPLNSIANFVNDWDRFRSTTFLCQLSNLDEKSDQFDIQPFCRNVQGKDLAWITRGTITATETPPTNTSNFFFRPIGSTDSEANFCNFLNHFFSLNSNSLHDIPWSDIYNYFASNPAHNNTDITLTDGQFLIHFRGKNCKEDMYLSRLVPPHENEVIHTDFASIDIVNASDPYRTVIFLTSLPSSTTKQKSIDPGGFVVIKRATIVYEQGAKLAVSPTFENPPTSISYKEADQYSINDNGSKKFITNLRSVTKSMDGKSLNYRILKVKHKTTYSYDKEIGHSTHIFRLSPVEDDSQEIIQSTLSFSTGGIPVFYEDSFGNKATHLTIEEPYTSFSILSESTVKLFERPKDDFNIPLRHATIPLLWMPWQRQMMLSYLLPSELPESQLAELSEFAMSFVERNDYDLIQTLNDINFTICNDFSYVSGSTSLKSTAFDVYTMRKGVCQDFANLFICLCRILSIPARYRTGYIYTGGNYENKIQSDASHAWVEVYLPYVGWRGFDPTNGCLVTQDHIRIACGRNFMDATPTSGTIYKGGGGTETLKVDVKVTEE